MTAVGGRAARERVAVRAVGRDQVVVVAQRARPRRRSSPPRRSRGAGSRRPWPCAYISPARSSKRRISSIVASHSRARRVGQRRGSRPARAGASAPTWWPRATYHASLLSARANSSRLELREVRAQRARERGAAARPAGPRTARPRRSSISTTSTWSTRSGSASSAGARPPRRDDQPVGVPGPHAGRPLAAARLRPRARPRRSPSKTARRRDRRDLAHAGRGRRRVASASAAATERSSAPCSTARRVHLAGRGGDQHVVGSPSVAPAGERLAEGRERERRPRGRSASRRSRRASRARCRTGSGSGQRSGCSPQLGARARSTSCAATSRSAAQRNARRAAAAARRQHRHPLGTTGSTVQHALGGEVRLRAGEVEVEGRTAVRSAQPWISQPSAARRGLHHGLRERRVAVDDARHLGVAALERAHVDELLDQLGRLRADDVAAEQLAVPACRRRS